MAQDKPLVLLTGANGHIGFRTLVLLLKSNYRVRAIVRSASKRDLILNAPSIRTLFPSPTDLEILLVPDSTTPSAYTSAVQNVDFVIHAGGPIPHGETDIDFEGEVLGPVVDATMGMLRACEEATGVKRVVITSSASVNMSVAEWVGGVEPGKRYSAESRTTEDEGPFGVDYFAYMAAKTRALARSEEWAREGKGKSGFDVVNVFPTVVIGPHELARSREELRGTMNFVPLDAVMGKTSTFSFAGASVHVDDVARILVEALDTTKARTGDDGLLSLGAKSNGVEDIVWEDALGVVRRSWPELVEKGVLPCDGKQGSHRVNYEASATETLLGFTFKSFEEQIKDVVGQWIELGGENDE